ncbi:MAG: hypothetical protein AAGC46_16150 [Solirubrobacteraceae bacterium]|nr:hypothetical protein [Patulibacter sp.]
MPTAPDGQTVGVFSIAGALLTLIAKNVMERRSNDDKRLDGRYEDMQDAMNEQLTAARELITSQAEQLAEVRRSLAERDSTIRQQQRTIDDLERRVRDLERSSR